MEHIPVLLAEITEFLKEHPPLKRVLDCTLGLGGYAEAVLSSFPDVELVGIDQDGQAISIAKERLLPFKERVSFVNVNFRSLLSHEAVQGPFDAVLFDLGVSNLQLVDKSRGFSFQDDGPLDMRMDSRAVLSAADIVNSYSATDLAILFKKYGEERYSRQIAGRIVRHRERSGPILHTSTLVEIIRGSMPAAVQRKGRGHPARRVFQALRIAVNEELLALREGLAATLPVVAPGALVIVVSYHSLEDRIVKTCFKDWNEQNRGVILTKRPITPTPQEVVENRKSRSAKMRVFKITGAVL
ncbi:MAG: 16S rRNA (cytosine(1402)-N(4))-methyltransferase RsmH [Synergistaceae bacterium]|nr:16S rRNA (cytosine(1402)-N(4))-methyltransferase RsmH [Synergistota bacterium]NLM70640.1 16S rRNA (cytosine(1402)-N(4))-methyltransferase RsmH [Synergistaceae bacterium]